MAAALRMSSTSCRGQGPSPAAKEKSDRLFARAQQAEIGPEDFEPIDESIEGEDDLPF